MGARDVVGDHVQARALQALELLVAHLFSWLILLRKGRVPKYIFVESVFQCHSFGDQLNETSNLFSLVSSHGYLFLAELTVYTPKEVI